MRADVHLPPFASVDEEDDYECVTVINSHTQDVKHVAWHPNQEVGWPRSRSPNASPALLTLLLLPPPPAVGISQL